VTVDINTSGDWLPSKTRWLNLDTIENKLTADHPQAVFDGGA
jgi:hypothetical protein